MQSLARNLKDFVVRNLFGILALVVSAFLVGLIMVWATLFFIWSNNGESGSLELDMFGLFYTVISVLFIVIISLFLLSRARLYRARALSQELEIARNLIVVNEYRRAVIDIEKATSGEN